MSIDDGDHGGRGAGSGTGHGHPCFPPPLSIEYDDEDSMRRFSPPLPINTKVKVTSAGGGGGSSSGPPRSRPEQRIRIRGQQENNI